MFLKRKVCYYKGMKKLASFITFIVLFATVGVVAFPAGDSYAVPVDTLDAGAGGGSGGSGTCEKTFLGMRPWYMGLTEQKADSTGKTTCVIKSPSGDGSSMANFVWKIILNIISDVTLMVGYVAIVFVVWGGYKYIMSNGEPGNVATAKKTITNALIGLVIALLSTVIVNTIIVVVNGAVK